MRGPGRIRWGTGAVWALAALAHAAGGEPDPSLPAAAADAIRRAFPGASVEQVRTEVLLGLRFLEVELKSGTERTQIALSEAGAIAEARTPVPTPALPKAVVDSVAQAVPGAQILKAQRLDSLAEVRFTRLDKPRVTYELVMVKGDQRGKVVTAADGAILDTLKWRNPSAPDDEEDGAEGDERILPKRAADAIRAARPRATIQEVGLREELGLRLYDAETQGSPGEGHVKVTENGSIVEMDTDVPAVHLPAAVVEAARRAAPDADIGGGRRQESLVEARLVQLPAPQFWFKITIAKDGKEGKMEIRPDGAVVGPVRWRALSSAQRR